VGVGEESMIKRSQEEAVEVVVVLEADVVYDRDR